MIIDNEADYVYFSSLLTTQNQYADFWRKLSQVLKQEGIPYGLIEGTRDIWCRDYMPVQIQETRFVQFKFFPDYYLDPDEIHKLTIPKETSIDYRFDCKYSELIIDGGNVVKSKGYAVLTDKIFDDNNHFSKDKVLATLKNDLETDNIVIIPRQPMDFTGHADGMVKFCNERLLMVSDYSAESKTWKSKMDKALDKSSLDIQIFPSVATNEKNNAGDYTAKGCYINFAQVGNSILLPQFGFKEDEAVQQLMKTLYPKARIIPIQSNDIAVGGGVLNCITWNIRRY